MALLNLPVFTAPRAYFVHPGTGRPVSLGSVAFFTSGTTIPKDVFADKAGVSLAPNPMPLDAAGSCEVYLSGIYRIELRDANGVVLMTADGINSTPVELATGNPGSLLIANNLADLADVPTARSVLGLTKQVALGDATADRVLTTGSGGLLGDGIRLSAANALNDPALATALYRVNAADVVTVGAPAGIGDCLVEVRRFSSTQAQQTLYPLTGSDRLPYVRTYSGGAWTAWRQDNRSGGDDTVGYWWRTADGIQKCWHPKVKLDFSTASDCFGTFTFPVTFVGQSYHVTATLVPANANDNSTLVAANCAPARNELLEPIAGQRFNASVGIRVHTRSTSFVSGNFVYASVSAEGRWFA